MISGLKAPISPFPQRSVSPCRISCHSGQNFMKIGYFTGNNPLLWLNLHLVTPTALLHADRVRNYGFPGIYCKFCTHIRHWRAIARILFNALPPQTYSPFFYSNFSSNDGIFSR